MRMGLSEVPITVQSVGVGHVADAKDGKLEAKTETFFIQWGNKCGSRSMRLSVGVWGARPLGRLDWSPFRPSSWCRIGHQCICYESGRLLRAMPRDVFVNWLLAASKTFLNAAR
jgi:hypothetical protein